MNWTFSEKEYHEMRVKADQGEISHGEWKDYVWLHFLYLSGVNRKELKELKERWA